MERLVEVPAEDSASLSGCRKFRTPPQPQQFFSWLTLRWRSRFSIPQQSLKVLRSLLQSGGRRNFGAPPRQLRLLSTSVELSGTGSTQPHLSTFVCPPSVHKSLLDSISLRVVFLQRILKLSRRRRFGKLPLVALTREAAELEAKAISAHHASPVSSSFPSHLTPSRVLLVGKADSESHITGSAFVHPGMLSQDGLNKSEVLKAFILPVLTSYSLLVLRERTFHYAIDEGGGWKRAGDGTVRDVDWLIR